MSNDLALRLMGELLWTAILITGPILGLTMLVGLIISIFQVVTQIQEQSLTFIPKIITVAVVLVIFGPWMLRTLIQYSTSWIGNIPVYF